jgi:hypothetical protein
LRSSQEWVPSLCRTCPVPSITRANACEFMVLTASVKRSALTLFKPRVQVSAYCEKTERNVIEPQIGCGVCHPILTTKK